MSDELNIKKVIPMIYQKQWIDQVCFGFICGVRAASPEISIEKAAIMFQDAYDLKEEELSIGTIRGIYHRMVNDLRQFRRENKKNPFHLNKTDKK